MNNENKQEKSASEIRANRQARAAKLDRMNRAKELQRRAQSSRNASTTEDPAQSEEAKNPTFKNPTFKNPESEETQSAVRKGAVRKSAVRKGAVRKSAVRKGAVRKGAEGREIKGREINSESQTSRKIGDLSSNSREVENPKLEITFEIITPIFDHSRPALGWMTEFDILREQNWFQAGTGCIELTDELINKGWIEISRARSLNTPIQIASPDGSRFWVKNEQSWDAASAETEVSAFYKYIGWPGCNLALAGYSTNVIVTPALGGPNIIDLGPIGELFPSETEEEGIIADRSFVLSKINLNDLNLINERDVVSFIVYNAIFANTDRHMMNLHLGSLLDFSGNSKGNILLPIDHGMCLKANGVWNKYFMPDHTPLDIITGSEIGFQSRNPHQLLRPFAQFAEMYSEDTELIMEIAISNVESFIDHGAIANGIILDHRAVSYMKENIGWMRQHKTDFIYGCQNIVLSEELEV